MWVVSKVGFVNKLGETMYELFYFMSDYGLRHFNIVIHLSNTETGGYKVLHNLPDPDTFLKELRSYSPYGFIDRNRGRDKIALDDVFVCIDELSLQFLNYIDHVEMLSILARDNRYAFYKDLEGTFLGLDRDFTVYVQNATGRCGCTLFHAMCYNTQGWQGDEYYLMCREHKDGVEDAELLIVMYKVFFSDIQSARRMLAKAAVSGINPVRRHESVEIR